MPRASANGIELEYESFGDGPPVVLVMGIGCQLILWPDGFCEALAARGYRVVRFDNRDVGLSTKLHSLGVPPVRELLARSMLGLPVEAPYDLGDMADDTVGLLDALGIDRAHVVGASMGGMIAQTMALQHPHRLASMTSVMSSPGGRRNIVGKPKALKTLLSKPPRTREEATEHHVAAWRVLAGPGFPFDEAGTRARGGLVFDRGHYPPGFARQFAAILASGDRRAALRFVRTPTLVIHGDGDPLIPLRAGFATARAIPGARLEIVRGMGHDLPAGAWPTLVDTLVQHFERSGARGGLRRSA